MAMIYLLPTQHTGKGNADDAIARLARIREREGKVEIAYEEMRDKDSRNLYRNLKHRSDAQLEEWASKYLYSEFTSQMLKKLKELHKQGIRTMPADLSAEQLASYKYFRDMGLERLSTNMLPTFKSQIENAITAYASLRIASEIKYPQIVDNVSEIATHSKCPVVAIFGECTTDYLYDNLGARISGVNVSLEESAASDVVVSTDQSLRYSAIRSVDPQMNVSDPLAVAKAVVFNNVLFCMSTSDISMTTKTAMAYASRIKTSSSMGELESIFDELQGLKRSCH